MIGSVAGQGNNDLKRLNIFYFSDYHGNIPAYRHLKEASDEFDRKNKHTESLKLAGGDLAAGSDPKKRILLYRLLNKMNLDASAVGNHEWDNGINFYGDFNQLFNKAPKLLFNKFISCNADTPDNKLYKQEGLFQSKIITKNNKKYAIIGATTFDKYQFEKCQIDDFEHTKQDISNEIQNLKKKDPSLDKFILVSHLGIDVDKEIAKSVPDIDIIIGGHSHTLIKGVEQGKNLFMSPKNEPVLIVQAGNERGFGELSVEFDKDGKLDISKGHEPVNITKSIYDYKENIDVKDLEDKILPPALSLGVLSRDIRPNNPLIEENPLGTLNADAIKKKTKADIVLLNAGCFRAFINAGKINQRNIEYCIPFSNHVMTIECSGKQIADIIKLGVDSTIKENKNPGLYQVSGLKYTITADNKVKNLYTVDKNGKKDTEIIDSQGKLTDKGANEGFKVALTDFVIVEIAKRGILKDFVKTEDNKLKVDKKKIIKKHDQQTKILIDYLKDEFVDKNRPIDFETGRITFEKSEKPEGVSFLSLLNKYTRQS